MEKCTFIIILGFWSTWASIDRPSVNLVEVYISLKTQKRGTLFHLALALERLRERSPWIEYKPVYSLICTCDIFSLVISMSLTCLTWCGDRDS